MFLINVSTKCFYHLINEQSYFYLSLDQSTVPPILVRLLRRMVSQLAGASTILITCVHTLSTDSSFLPNLFIPHVPSASQLGLLGLYIRLTYPARVFGLCTYGLYILYIQLVYSVRLLKSFTQRVYGFTQSGAFKLPIDFRY